MNPCFNIGHSSLRGERVEHLEADPEEGVEGAGFKWKTDFLTRISMPVTCFIWYPQSQLNPGAI